MTDSAIDEDVLRITRIRAKNYRSIRELDMELGPLTVLVGPNASGKSNVLDVLRFIRDAISYGLDFAISQRYGIRAFQHLHRPGRGKRRDVELGFSAIIPDFTLEYNFVLTSDSNGNHRVKREYGSYRLGAELPQVDFDIRDSDVIKPTPVSTYIRGLYDSIRGDPKPFPSEDLAFFKYYGNFVRDEEQPLSIALLNRGLLELQKGVSELGFYHVIPDAVRVPKQYVGSYILDEHGANLTSTLWEMRPNRGNAEDSEELTTEGFRELRDALKHLMPGISDVKSELVGEYLALRFKHSNIVRDEDVWLAAAQESDGTLRMLALLTAIYQRRRPPVLGIEEPESAVHPGVLAALAEILDEASLRQQVVITTHSPDLIDHLPIKSIRAVEFVDGETKVGEVSKRQASAVKKRLFTLGELHSMEGLEINAPVAQ